VTARRYVGTCLSRVFARWNQQCAAAGLRLADDARGPQHESRRHRRIGVRRLSTRAGAPRISVRRIEYAGVPYWIRPGRTQKKW